MYIISNITFFCEASVSGLGVCVVVVGAGVMYLFS